MRNQGSFAVLSLCLSACGPQEPAATPLAAPPPATVAAVPPPPATAEVKPEEPKAVALTPEQKLKLYQDGWAAFNAKDFPKFQAVFADDAINTPLDMGPPVVGAPAIAENARAFAAAFPDITGELELTLINGSNAFGVVLLRGTQKGPYATPVGEVPATDKKVGLLAAHGVQFNDLGKAQAEWMAYDGGTIAGQLGLMPLPHRKVIEAGWTDKPVVIASNSDTEKANVAAFNQGIDGFNKHDAAAALASASDDLVFSELSAPADRTGKKEALKGIEDLFKAFPDVKLDVKSVWGAGDYVVATGAWNGTNTGDMPLAHLKKTGKTVSVQFVEVDKFAAGKTKDIWIFSNGAAVAAQLGLVGPKPEHRGGKPGSAHAQHEGTGGPKPVSGAPGAKPVMADKPTAPGKPAPSPALK